MAAGLGFKDFQTGEVLTAADVDGYLMQGIWVFTNATARDAAVTSPQEGNFAFTKDNNSLWYYDGAAWVASGATGDIEGVTAGIGISGGGTSGTVTVTNSMATAIDAKGDLVVGTGADTFSRLAVGGTNGHVLTVDNLEATGMKWAAAGGGGGGKVLQVVQATTTTATTIASTNYTDTNLSASITPSSATSKVLVMWTQQVYYTRAAGQMGLGFNIRRASTDVFTSGGNTGADFTGIGGSTSIERKVYLSGSYLDSPATTSATTYKTQARIQSTANSGSSTFQESSDPSSIILLEIGA